MRELAIEYTNFTTARTAVKRIKINTRELGMKFIVGFAAVSWMTIVGCVVHYCVKYNIV